MRRTAPKVRGKSYLIRLNKSTLSCPVDAQKV
jgi:hypothetical protein